MWQCININKNGVEGFCVLGKENLEDSLSNLLIVFVDFFTIKLVERSENTFYGPARRGSSCKQLRETKTETLKRKNKKLRFK